MSKSIPSSDDSMTPTLTHKQTQRAFCSGCAMLSTHCLCDSISALPSRTQLLVLQHPQEAKHHKNTVKLLTLNIPNTQIIVGEQFDPNDFVQLQGLSRANTFLLYPSDQSIELESVAALQEQQAYKVAEPLTLIVIDSSWKKSKKMYLINQWLHSFQSFHLKLDQSPSIYQIRKKREAHFRSTLEASVIALNILEDYPIEPCYQLLDRFCELKIQDINQFKNK
ncbi:tRNA-uridine aminocarboxypropyltransferase [Marinicellulosiphila megalodicopiae]|uniref:tRNA-uridine aminocarboxypropyltransferase n=1 Tax=Marinicellulosiphila megalodicopiae TaxID=2724896 RepID=UPI003BB161D5